jgi:RNA polymerase sigma-70 factor (ECF subfamily)
VERVLSQAWPEVVGTVRRQMTLIVGGRDADLDDLTQTALERLVRASGRFEERSDFATYAYRTCLRVVLNHRRWARRWLAHRESFAQEPSAEESADPVDDLVAAERCLRVRAALERMQPDRRTALLLSDVEDLPASRVAEIAGCPEPTVRSRLRAARAELSAALLRDRALDLPRARHGRDRALLTAIAVLVIAAIAAAAYFYFSQANAPERSLGAEMIAVHAGAPKHEAESMKTATSTFETASDPAPTVASAKIEVPATSRGGPAVDLRREFRLAEDELARGDVASGRARLQKVIAGADHELAGDAMFVLARRTADPKERAQLLAIFLARNPPSPYREQAMVERAEALLDAGDKARARAIVLALRAQEIPSFTVPALRRVEQRSNSR